MPARAIVHEPGAPPREVPIPPDGSVEVLPSLRVSSAEVPGLVVEGSALRIRVEGRRVAAGERVLLVPGAAILVGEARVEAAWDDPGTAAEARAVLLAAIRGEAPRGVTTEAPLLVALRGPLAGSAFPLRDGVLGRGPGASVRLPDPAISRAHARLDLGTDGLLLVEDLGSRNGTFVGRRRLRGSRAFRPGQPFRAGRTVLALSLHGTRECGTRPPLLPSGLSAARPPDLEAAAGRRARPGLLLLAALLAAAIAATLAGGSP